MKNKIFAIILLLFSASCSDVLVEEPKAIATETFYKTASEIESAVLGVYAPVKDAGNCMGGLYQAQMEAQVDYGYGRGSYAVITEFQGLNATNITRVGQFWAYFYRSIRNANTVIKNAPNASSVDEATLNALVGEAKFLRAFCYFHMVRNWGDIPLRTEENMLDQDVPRTPASQVYDLIISDLNFAEQYLPEHESVAGRASKWAAKSLLADVYMQLGQYSQARTKSLEVINSGRYSLINISTSNDYYKIFGPGVTSSSEEIFYLKYNSTEGSQYAIFAHHPGDGYLNGQGYYALYSDSVKNKVIRDWDYHDLRKKFNLFSYNIGLGSTTVLYKKYIDPTRTSGATNDYPCYGLADLLLLYAEADCRANSGPTSDGLEKLNMIHRRAYGKNPNVASTVDFKLSDYTMDSFIDLVMKERMYETFYEGKRWLDLKRTGKLKAAIMDAYGIQVADMHLWWPIPNVEYDYNKAIDPETDQNPGY